MNLEVISARYDSAEKTTYTVRLRDKDGEFLGGEVFPYGVIVGKSDEGEIYRAIMEQMSAIEILDYIEPEVPEAVLARSAREKRDALLTASDYLIMPDYPIDDETLAKVKAYRQALRDITEQEGFPRSITWPELP